MHAANAQLLTKSLHAHRHLLDFAEDLYDQVLSVDLRLFLRAEVAFVDTPALVDQLAIDVQNTRDWFAAGARAAA